MTFLAPYFLFAASALLIPIAIHLWNKRQGKTVKIGSLRWLEASASQRWSSVKLNNVWLLLLRCLILLLLAFALAQPVLVRPPKAPQMQKAVYIGQELLYTAAARQQIQPTVDSLLQRGYRLHLYTPGFTALSREQWQQHSHSAKDSVLESSANYWALLPALAEKHQPQDSVWLFTSDQQRFFAGTRPAAVPGYIRWIPVSSEASAVWLQAAVQTSPDSLLLVIGKSTRDGITYSRHLTPAAANSIVVGNQQLLLQRRADTLQAVWPDKRTSQVRVQTAPMRIAILAEEAQQPEVRYLQAAISAISHYTRIPMHTAAAQDTAADWVFWLRSDAVPPQLQQQVAQQGLQLWVQPATEPTATQAHLPATAGENVAVHQLHKATGSQAQHPIWTTDTGEELLTVQPKGKGHIYYFRSAFQPAWSDLGQSPQLPELLLPLLFPRQRATTYDVRALDERQLKPAPQAVSPTAPVAEAGYMPLLPWFVLAAFILFLVERTIAGRRGTA